MLVPIISFFITQRTPGDPNDITGPAGFGPNGFVPAGQAFPYTIQFQNEPTATAQVVTVTESLDPSLDWSTFQLGDFGFGGIEVAVPPGLSSYSTRIDLRSTLGLFVDVTAGLDLSSGIVTWTFTSIDPSTLDLPSNVLSGFLPPDENPPEGEAFINYMVRPKATDVTGTVINAKATVIFDAGLPDQSSLDTAPIFNTIDAGPPSTSVAPLPAEETSTSFNVTWSGQDDPGGSGVAFYNIYESEDGGPYSLWQSDTTATSATFDGVNGDTYSFYSVATDNVGNVEATPPAAQATTEVVAPLSPVSIAPVSPNPRNTPVSSVEITFNQPVKQGSFTAAALRLTDNGGPNLITSAVTIGLVSGSTYDVSGLASLTSASGTYTFTVDASQIDDPNGSPGTGTLSTSWVTDTTTPTSSVSPLPAAETSTSFMVSWSGTDGAGPGIASYNLYVSDNGGPFAPFLMGTALTSATFTGQAGHTYGFFSVATDTLGFSQPTPIAAQATTRVVLSPPPPPLVTVQSLKVETIKVGKGKKAKKETVLVLDFSGALNAVSADNAGAYELAPVIKVKATGKGKNRKPATTRLGAPVAPASAVYSASNNSVTLTPRGKLTATKPEELIVNGALISDALGREIDGNDDGQPGGDYIATVSGTRVTPGGLPLARTREQPAPVTAAIDALLARGELAVLKHAFLVRHGGDHDVSDSRRRE